MPRNDMIQFRRGSSDQWALINPILAEGEVGYTTDTKQTRVGDGLTPWLSLPLSSADQALDAIETGRLSEAQLSATIADISEPAAQAAVTDSVRPSAFLSRSVNVVLAGDSNTFGTGSTNASVDSYRAYFGKILGTDRVNVINGGVGGDSAANLLARIPALIADNNPGLIVVMIGTNASASLTAYIADVRAILDLIEAARIPVILNAVIPRGSSTAAANQARTTTYNLFLRSEAARRSIPFADTWTALVDPATSVLAAAYDSDGTHLTPAGHLVIARAVAQVADAILPSPEPISPVTYAPNLVTNALMQGGGPSTFPTNWAAGGTSGTGGVVTVGTEAPVADDLAKSGAWMKVIVDASAASGTVTTTRHNVLDGGAMASGDVIMIEALVKSAVGSETRGKLTFADGATDRYTVLEQAGVNEPGRIRRIYTLASAVAAPRVRFSVTAAIGTVQTAYLAEVQVTNLTALGLAGIITA